MHNVLRIYEDTIAQEGGTPGVRDAGLLAAAVDMPQAGFDGQMLHEDIAAMAAAYLYHLCQNHPFVDGNKRTAAFAAVLFLSLNGVPDDRLPGEDELEALTWQLASGDVNKADVTRILRS